MVDGGGEGGGEGRIQFIIIDPFTWPCKHLQVTLIRLFADNETER
jgi:hypothetical protein